MSTSVSVFAFLVTLMLSMQQGVLVMGFKEVKVGGSVQKWHVPNVNDTSFYERWASNKRFHVGDSLRFEYENDSVLIVDKYGYYHCDPTKPISTFNDGNTTIKLDRPGLSYFISGSIDNCHDGERVIIDVMIPHPHPIASPPEAHDYDAVSPSPEGHAKSSGSRMVHGSIVLGFVVIVVGFMLF